MPYEVVRGDYTIQRENSIPYFLRKGTIPSFSRHGKPVAFNQDDIVFLLSVFHNGITRTHFRRAWFGNGSTERSIDERVLKASGVAKAIMGEATDMIKEEDIKYEKATGEGKLVVIAKSEIILPKHRDYVFAFWPKNPEEFYANLTKK